MKPRLFPSPKSMEKPQDCFDVNISGTSILFKSARKAGVRRAVIASSAAVYGDSDALPLKEETPLRPLSPYAVSKCVDEMFAQLYTSLFGLEVVALRYFNVYGPRQRPDSMYAAAVPIFIRRLRDGQPITVFGDGGQTRDLVFVGDVVRANLIASEHLSAAGRILTFAPGKVRASSICLMCCSGFFRIRPSRCLHHHAWAIFISHLEVPRVLRKQLASKHKPRSQMA